MSSLDYARRQRFATMIVGQYGLSYREDPACKVPHATSTGEIVMPPFPIHATDEDKDYWLWSLIHECYHHIHSADFRTAEEVDLNMQSKFGHAMNMIVDHNIERSEFGVLHGADALCCNAYENTYSTNIQKVGQFDDTIAAIQALDIKSRAHWCVSSDFNVVDVLSPTAKEKFDKIAHLEEEYATPRPAGQANLDLCEKIFRLLDEEDEIEEGKSGDPDSGDGGGDGEGEESQGKAKGGEKSDDGEEGEAGGRNKVKYETLSPDDHSQDKEAQHEGLDYWYEFDKLKGDPIKMTPIDEHRPPPTDNKYTNQSLGYGLSTKVKNLLKVASRAKYTGGMTSGRINKRRLASVTTGNERVFKQKTTRDILDTAVFVLVDGSGSMSGERYKCATAAGALLGDCMRKINIPTKIGVFSTGYNRNSLNVPKEFNESVEPEELLRRLGNTHNIMNSNSDGEFLLHAADQLAQRKEKRKVLIVLSDGQPAANVKGDEVSFTRKVAQDLERSPIEVYSIGIQSQSVKDFYKRWRVIDRPSQLEEALFGVIKEAILS